MFWKKGLLGVIALALLVVVGRQVAADATDAKTSDKESVRRDKISDRQMAQWLERMAADESEARKDAETWDAGPERRAKVVAGPNLNAVLSLDLIPNGGAGNQRDDGVTSGTVSGQGTTIAVEVFATGVTTSLQGMVIKFNYDASVLTFVNAENSAFAFSLPEPDGTGTNFAATSPVTLGSSGFLARAEFTTAVDVTGRAFSIGIATVSLLESSTLRDDLTTTDVITFNAPLSSANVSLMHVPDSGRTQGVVSGQGTEIVVEVSQTGITQFVNAIQIVFEFDSSLLTLNAPAGWTLSGDKTVALLSITPVPVPASARFTFTTKVDVTGREFSIGINQATLGINQATLDRVTFTPSAMITFNAALSPDFNGDGTVDTSDLVLFQSKFGLSRGDAGYDAKYDLDSDGAIGVSDFQIFTNSFGQQVTPSGATVTIADANLRAVIEESLGKASGASITRTEMASLTRLDAGNNGIRSLTGLEHATNLQTLDLGRVRVNGELVNSNDISNLSPLSNLTNLTSLYLHYNSISDISALSNLTNLTFLRLDQNSISDISALSNLTNLTFLRLDQNSISDISALSNLTNLTSLRLFNNSISDISALSNLTNLTVLNLWGNSISDISALSNLTNLTSLYLDDNSISDISALSNLTNLTWLSLQFNSISDISALSNLTNLTSLYLDDNSISDISALSNLTNLTSLYLFNNSISDVSALSGLTDLTTLLLQHNSISDISALSNLTNLTWLRLYTNSISDISVLSNLTNLTSLELDDNSISDIAPLVANTGLGSGDTVRLRSNPLSATSINTHIPALQGRGVTVEFSAPDEYGNTRSEATSLSLGSSRSGQIDPGSDVDYFKVEVSESGTLTVYTTGSLNTVGELQDSSGSRLASNDDSGSGANFRIERSVSAGTYYIEVGSFSSNTGSYTVHTSFSSGGSGGGGGSGTYGVGESLPNYPSGFFVPSRLSGARFSYSGGRAVLSFDNGGVVELSDGTTYTCIASGGCGVEGGRVTVGTIRVAGSGSTGNGGGGGGGGGGSPDLSVDSPSVSNSALTTGQAFTLSATVRNSGTGSSASTTLRYYRSSDATISASDTEVGTDSVGGLSASGSSAESISLNAPSNSGTYYYGACVESVTGESNTNNNCSDGVRVTVSRSGGVGTGNTYGVGESLPNYPSGFFVPSRLSGARFSYSGGRAVLSFDNGGVVELSDGTTYTCVASGGCGVEGGRVTSGTIRVAGSGSTGDGGGGGGGVTIPDANLRAVIENSLNKASGASITRAEMATLTRLHAPNKGIRSLTGLEQATNLQRLDLGFVSVNGVLVNSNDISNLSPLSNLTNLTDLDLSGTSISDISALSNLTNLTSLDLASNSISDISALSNLTNLTDLRLGSNRSLSDISALSNLTNLTSLDFQGSNSISDISALSNLASLRTLVITYNGGSLSDISALSNGSVTQNLNQFEG